MNQFNIIDIVTKDAFYLEERYHRKIHEVFNANCLIKLIKMHEPHPWNTKKFMAAIEPFFASGKRWEVDHQGDFVGYEATPS